MTRKKNNKKKSNIAHVSLQDYYELKATLDHEKRADLCSIDDELDAKSKMVQFDKENESSATAGEMTSVKMKRKANLQECVTEDEYYNMDNK